MFLNGNLNPRWNGGTSEYPNHAEMKRIRLEILEVANYTCSFCGESANEIHHKDLSKDNHSKNNLVACCHRCNSKRSKPYTSKYKRLYGQTADEMAILFGKTGSTIINWHKKGILTSKLERG